MTLTCACCGERYERGQFLCCRPPNGMNSTKWLERHCQDCKKCPRHCACGGVVIPPVDGWERLMEIGKRKGWDRPERVFSEARREE